MVTRATRVPYEESSYPWSFRYWDQKSPEPTDVAPGFDNWSIEHELSNARFSMGLAKPNIGS